MRPLSILNFFVLQWIGLRLVHCARPDGTKRYRVLRWVLPLTGWWGDHRWIYRVCPLLQIGKTAVETDQGETKAEEEAAWEEANNEVGHYVIYRSVESDELARDVGAEKGGDVNYTLMGAETQEQNVESLYRYDPEGTHELAVELYLSTWREAKQLQRALNEGLFDGL